ncbi:hypothetical protein LEN26_007101 [Aphanomyces euteiches]|nr:hypothetical protein AeMF1_019035 [Aphanomyces euteiches]KAH9133469.1 hypothetical protein LEN26_007101 [Aphanomyces euteiches]KAH9192632.1 hypothetical protein AeNC1_005401 [Aphanomyces euteiches]
MQRQERIYDRTQSVRAALAFDTSPRSPQTPSTPPISSLPTWRRQLAVVWLAGQVVAEMCRRIYLSLTRAVASCFVALDHFYVRCFNSQFPVAFNERRRMTPVLALLLALVIVSLVRFAVAIPYQYYHINVHLHKPTDDSILAHILVDSSPDAPKRPNLRGETFVSEPWKGQCSNTASNGHEYATDSRGYTCKRSALLSTGCCSGDILYSCSSCDVEAPHCCEVYDRCVSCCMGPANTALVHAFLAHADPKHPVYGQSPALTLFGFCSFRCRTSSAGVQSQNSYRSARKHCYGLHRPLKELDVVNSNGESLARATAVPSHEELRERVHRHQPPPLEFDPFYLGKS